MSGKGLAAHYHFSRQPGIFGDRMVSVQVTLTNTIDQKIENIHVKDKKLPPGMKMIEFNPIGNCILSLKIYHLWQNLKYRKVFLRSHTYTHTYVCIHTNTYVCIHTHTLMQIHFLR